MDLPTHVLDSGRQECAALHFHYFRCRRALLLEDQSVIPGQSKIYRWESSHIWSSECGENQFSSLPDCSSPYWVSSDGPKSLSFWPFLPSSLLMILSAYPKIPSSSFNFLFVPLSGAGCCWRWWCSMHFRSCRRRESHKENWSQIFWGITLSHVILLCALPLFLHFKDALLLGFVARFLEELFCCQYQKEREKKVNSLRPHPTHAL